MQRDCISRLLATCKQIDTWIFLGEMIAAFAGKQWMRFLGFPLDA
jgi:hypothetical protein